MSDKKQDQEKHRKFDVIIGNPPYQEEAHGDQKLFTAPIYDKFMDQSYKVGNIVELITPARFLFNAGSTPKKWNRQMLDDPHLKVVHYFGDSSKVFSGVDIAAGVAVTLRNANEDFGPITVFTPYDELNSIRKKVAPYLKDDNLSNHAYVQNKFNIDALHERFPDDTRTDKRLESNIFSKYPLIFTKEKENENQIPIFGVIKNKRVFRYIDKKYLDLSHENLFKYKVLVPKTNGVGVFGEALVNPRIEDANEGYTRTFVGIGALDTKDEAENLFKYIKSKFARVLLDILKVTQDTSREKWRFVPWQDFSDNSDIDWSKSVSEIDQQLYKKYGLSDDEIDFVEKRMQEMK